MANIISWNGDATGLTTVSSDFTDSNGQVIHHVLVKISDKMPNLEGAIISGVFQGNNVSNWTISSDEIVSDNGVYNAEGENAGAVVVVTEANSSIEGMTFSEKGTYVGYSASTGSTSISMWSNISIEYSSELVKSTTFPIPEVYKPYINVAKKIYEDGHGGEYTHIAVAENQNYISVHFLTDDFRLVTYDPDTTIYTATGIAFVTYAKKTDQWSTDVVDNTTSTSEGSRYLNHWVWAEVDVTWDGSTVFTTTEGWYYNSVKLPDIDDVWTDKETYPYAYISKVRDNYLEVAGSAYMLIVGSANAVFNENGDYDSFYISGDFISYKLNVDTNSWEFVNSETDSYVSVGYPAEAKLIFCDLVWCNYEVLEEDESVHISSSEPVHVTMDVPAAYDPISFQIGLAFGLCGKGIPEDLQVVGGNSNMYAYNDAVLPSFPEYDESVYTHAWITEWGTTLRTLNVCSQKPVSTVNPDNADVTLSMAPAGSKLMQCHIAEDESTYNNYLPFFGDYMGLNEWGSFNVLDTTDSARCGDITDQCWANFDILNLDGTVLLAASEPIPMCSYNGANLPDINTVWTDKNKYPYAYLVKFTNWNLFLFSSPVEIVNDNVVSTTAGSYVTCVDDVSHWVYYNDEESAYRPVENLNDLTVNSYPANYIFSPTSSFSIGWSNVDVQDVTNNVIFLPASVPVGGTNSTIDQASFLAGYKAGAELRRLRLGG